ICPMLRFVDQYDKLVGAYNEAVNDCEAQSTAVANAFGREKRLEDSGPNPCTHSYAVITNRHAQITFCCGIRIRHLRACNDHGLEGQFAAVRERGTGVYSKVQQGLIDLIDIDGNKRYVRIKIQSELDSLWYCLFE